LESFLRARIVKRGKILLLPGRAKGRGRRASRRRCATTAAKDSRAVNADVRELVEMRDADVERLAAAHRQPGDRAMRSIGDDAVVFFDVWHHVLHEVLA